MSGDYERAREALNFVSPFDRDTWVRMGMGVKAEFSDEGFDLWDEWSRGADNYSATSARSVWKGIQPTGDGISIASVFYEAKQNGWKPNGGYQAREISPQESAERERRIKAAREKDERDAKRASETFREVWKHAQRLGADHPYMVSRGVEPTDSLREIPAEEIARIAGYAPKHEDEPLQGRVILVPIKAQSGGIVGGELIDERGLKTVLYGTTVKGGYWCPEPLPTGDGEGLRVLIAEGMATTLSARAATGDPCMAARACGNLRAVAAIARERYPKAEVVILAEQGGGLRYAEQAARENGAKLAVFEDDANTEHRTRGLTAVKERIGGAQSPAPVAVQAPATENRPGAILASGRPTHGAPITEDWPGPLDPEAFQGLAGDIVNAIEPNTEADPAAVLLQTLIAFGALVGRGPHIRVEGDEHHPRLFGILVGRSGRGRKGTSWGRCRELFAPIIGWPRVVDGLSSGEGLKWAVRDPIRKQEKDKQGIVSEVEVDGGVADKRMLVMESEFAQTLRQCSRPGNTLSATIRSAWDNGNLQTLTKNDPTTATGAHINVIGHITADELRAELTATDSANGFANRFLFMAVERSKRLPFGGADMSNEMRGDLCERIARAAGTARTRQQMNLTAAAREVWASIYAVLSEGHPGLLGAVTARAEAQTLRLALTYALMDEAEAVDVPHLEAALAVWERCESSARFVFGAAVGDRIADVILRALRAKGEEGLSRTEISKLFSKNETAERIGTALALLEQKGLAKRGQLAGPGRPAEIWGLA